MALLARKISLAKWAGAIDEPIGADALSCDLRTARNTLSFWRFNADEPLSYEEAALALTAGQRELDKIDIVGLDEAELQREAGVELANSDGVTLVARLKSCHVDAVALDVDRLAQIAHVMARRVRAGARHVKRFSKHQVRELLKRAILAGHLSVEDMELKIRQALEV